MKTTKSSKKRALVTGSAGGIGSAVARDLARQGYHLILMDINEEANSALAKELPSAETVTMDLNDREALRVFCVKIDQYAPDIAFINAGMVYPGDVEDIPERYIDLQLEINLRSTILLNQACGSYMREKGAGHIVNTVSQGGIIGLKSSAVYSAAKFGLRGFLMAFHSEMKPFGVHVSGLYPAAVDTPMLRAETESDGSVLNFLNKPSTVEDLVKGFAKAIRTKKLEVYIPHAGSISTRILGGLVPNMLHGLYPTFEKIGKRGREKYLQRLEQQETSTAILS